MREAALAPVATLSFECQHRLHHSEGSSPGPAVPTDRQDTAKPCVASLFNLAMTHVCCFSPLSQTPKLFFQIGRRPEPGRLHGAQQPHEMLALTDHNMAPSGRPENTAVQHLLWVP